MKCGWSRMSKAEENCRWAVLSSRWVSHRSHMVWLTDHVKHCNHGKNLALHCEWDGKPLLGISKAMAWSDFPYQRLTPGTVQRTEYRVEVERQLRALCKQEMIMTWALQKQRNRREIIWQSFEVKSRGCLIC